MTGRAATDVTDVLDGLSGVTREQIAGVLAPYFGHPDYAPTCNEIAMHAADAILALRASRPVPPHAAVAARAAFVRRDYGTGSTYPDVVG